MVHVDSTMTTTEFISRATDYKITLVFRLKAQSRAMGKTADT